MSQSDVAFVSSTSVAAELSSVSKIARDMSISVKNAKAIANRAGAKARGFSPITDYIDEMSIETMKLVNVINLESIELSRVAIRELQIRDAKNRFESVYKNTVDIPGIHSFSSVLSRMENNHKQVRMELTKYSKNLKTLMYEISQKMAVANVIVSNSRIEAVNAEEYRDNLESIADDIEEYCAAIRERVKKSEQKLDSAILQWKRTSFNEINNDL